jgi:hypothetical protein
MKLLASQRFYAVYSGILTAVLAVVLFTGFDAKDKDQTGKEHDSLRVRELTVQRINIVEPDGTLRMVVSNKARMPGIYIKGVERLPGHHSATAGMLFMNDEGTETGGLSFSGFKDAQGNVRSSGHLSFDRYMQDQVITMSSSQTNEERSTLFNVLDQPSWPIEEFIDLIERIEDLPPEQQQAEVQAFLASHEMGAHRMSLGRRTDRSVALEMKDAQGRVRAVLKVDADGAGRLQFLDETGAVTNQFPN